MKQKNYELAKEELTAFFEMLKTKYQWNRINTVYLGKLKEKDWESFHWRINISGPSKPQCVFKYCMGLAHAKKGRPTPPDPAEVVARYADDFLTAHEAMTWNNFAKEFGYDSDSRSAFDIYQASLNGVHQLQGIGLTLEEITKLAKISNGGNQFQGLWLTLEEITKLEEISNGL